MDAMGSVIQNRLRVGEKPSVSNVEEIGGFFKGGNQKNCYNETVG